MTNCDHAKAAPKAVLEDLPHSQAGTARHKCATCAYAAGVKAGRQQVLESINTALQREIAKTL